MLNWHAPRANRWEQLDVVAGVLQTEWLEAAGIRPLRLEAGEQHWVAPGCRWRVARNAGPACFELAMYADETVSATAPQNVRSALLVESIVVRVNNPAELPAIVAALPPGERRLVRAGADAGRRLHEVVQSAGDRVFWHPLDASPQGCTALVARATEPVGLAEYLGRDHAVIEGALAGALRGDPEHTRWLHRSLERHMKFEEDVLFPAYIDAAGRAEWVQDLLRDHQDLSHHLPRLDDPRSRRRFLLVLDGHDEREEQIVYPDIRRKLAVGSDSLALRIMHYPLAM